MVLTFQFVECAEPFLHVNLSLGVVFYALSFVLYLAGHVHQFYAATLQSLCQVRGRSEYCGDSLQQVLGLPQGLHHTPFVSVQHLTGTVESRLDFLGMFQRPLFLFQFLFFPFLQVGFLQLAELERQVVLLILVSVSLLPGFLQLFLRVPVVCKELSVAFPVRLVLCQQVQYLQLEILLGQQQVLVLGVDVDELFAQCLQLCQSHRRVVDEGAALARSRQFAAYDTLPAIVIHVHLFEERLHGIAGHVEGSLDDATLRSLPYGLAVSPLSQEQSDGSQQDGLSRSRLAGDDGESILEVNVQRFDECVVLNI